MINIRRAQHKDALEIIDSHVRSIREICEKDYTPEQIEAWAGRNFKLTFSLPIDKNQKFVSECSATSM